MEKQIEDKLCKNALIAESLLKLTKEERQKIVNKLLLTKSERELGEEIGVPHSTIHDWKTLRQSNVGEDIHVSLPAIIRKLEAFTPSCNVDFVKLHRIANIVKQKLEVKK
jgi:hypothetical protein